MAFSTPTLFGIQENIVSDIETEFGQTVPILEKAVWRVLSLILAGVWIILYKFGSIAFKQRFPQTANSEFLEILGEIVNVVRQQATSWQGEGEVESTASVGTLPPNTQLVNNNTGIVYLTREEVVLTVGTLTLKLKTIEGGQISDLETGDTINFVESIPGLAETVEITLTTIDGEDQEDIEVYRRRVLDAYQKKPQGGASADYEQWAEEAPNVINAYPYPGTLPGEVSVYIEVDDQIDGIPTGSQLTVTLEQYINVDPVTGRATRRPVTADVSVLPISRRVFDVEIVALSPDTPEIRADIDAALTEFFLGKEPFIEGVSIVRNDTINRSQIESTVDTVTRSVGATFSAANLEESGSPIDAIVLNEGEKAKLGATVYV